MQFLPVMLPSSSAQANPTNSFDWENLQSDIHGVAERFDSQLVNPWGLALNTKFNVFWVADNATDVSTLYLPDGTPVPLVVTIPPTPAENPTLPSAPTGIVFNTFAHAFLLPNNQPAAFIFDGEDGRITAWNGGNTAVNAFDVRNGTPLGPVLHRKGQPLQFDGLWAIVFFGDKLYLNAGIVDEGHGLFGFIHKEQKEGSDD